MSKASTVHSVRTKPKETRAAARPLPPKKPQDVLIISIEGRLKQVFNNHPEALKKHQKALARHDKNPGNKAACEAIVDLTAKYAGQNMDLGILLSTETALGVRAAAKQKSITEVWNEERAPGAGTPEGRQKQEEREQREKAEKETLDELEGAETKLHRQGVFCLSCVIMEKHPSHDDPIIYPLEAYQRWQDVKGPYKGHEGHLIMTKEQFVEYSSRAKAIKAARQKASMKGSMKGGKKA